MFNISNFVLIIGMDFTDYATEEWTSKSKHKHAAAHQQPRGAGRVSAVNDLEVSWDDRTCKLIHKNLGMLRWRLLNF